MIKGTIFLSALVIPASVFAYSAVHFKADTLKAKDPNEVEEPGIDDERVLWDTQCRDELGLEGGHLLGALKFNLNRCVNNKKRQFDLEKRQAKYLTRSAHQKQKNEVNAAETGKNTSDYMIERVKKSSKIFQAQKKTLPKTIKEKKTSFQSVRASRRSIVTAKEHEIRKNEAAENKVLSKAKKACAGLKAEEKVKCIGEKIKEMKEESE